MVFNSTVNCTVSAVISSFGNRTMYIDCDWSLYITLFTLLLWAYLLHLLLSISQICKVQFANTNSFSFCYIQVSSIGALKKNLSSTTRLAGNTVFGIFSNEGFSWYVAQHIVSFLLVLFGSNSCSQLQDLTLSFFMISSQVRSRRGFASNSGTLQFVLKTLLVMFLQLFKIF